MPIIFFCRRETDYLKFPVFWTLSPYAMSAGADFEAISDIQVLIVTDHWHLTSCGVDNGNNKLAYIPGP